MANNSRLVAVGRAQDGEQELEAGAKVQHLSDLPSLRAGKRRADESKWLHLRNFNSCRRITPSARKTASVFLVELDLQRKP